MGEQKFNKNFPEVVYSINDKPMDALTRIVIKLQASLEENKKILEDGEELLAEGMESNKIAKELGYAQDDLSDLRKRIEKTRSEMEASKILLKSYERQIDLLKKGDERLQKMAQSKTKRKNWPSA